MSTAMSADAVAAAPSQASSRGRLLDIERGKGLGILLVVYGHLVMFGTYGEQAWYAMSKDAIYLFHMPLFMYLSGYVFTYSKAAEKAQQAYGRFVARRADRLLVPFFVSAIVIVLGKYFAGQFMAVDQGVSGIGDGFRSVFFDTENSPVLSIWYVYVLFVYSAVMPLLVWATRGNLAPLLVLGLVLYFIPATTDFYLFRVFHYFIFFVVGCYVAQHREVLLGWFDRLLWPALALAFASLFLDRDWYPALLIAGLIWIPTVHGLMRLPLLDGDRVLLFFGRYSMTIYLFNTIAIGVAKVLYARFLPYDGAYFVLFVAVLMAAGTFVPILIRMTLGVIDQRGVVTKYLD